MNSIEIYTTAACFYCERVKQLLLNKKNIAYKEIRVDTDPEKREEMIARSGKRTVPQVFINGKAIGGSEEVYALEKAGKLDALLKSEECEK